MAQRYSLGCGIESPPSRGGLRKKNGPIPTPKLPYLIHNAEIVLRTKMAYRWIDSDRRSRPVCRCRCCVRSVKRVEPRFARKCQYISVVGPFSLG